MSTAIRESLFATDRERAQARDLTEWIDSHQGPNHAVVGTVELPPELAGLLSKALKIIASGGSVTLGSIPEELSTTVAADILGVSRTTLMKLVRDGSIPHEKVGSHTRLRREDVLHFKAQRVQKQRAALRELIELEDSLGL